MYSAAKARLDAEKQAPTLETLQNTTTEDLNAKTKAINNILETIQPLVEVKIKATQEVAAARKAVVSLNEYLTQITVGVQALIFKLDQLENAKSQNADLERSVLNKLNDIL